MLIRSSRFRSQDAQRLQLATFAELRVNITSNSETPSNATQVQAIAYKIGSSEVAATSSTAQLADNPASVKLGSLEESVEYAIIFMALDSVGRVVARDWFVQKTMPRPGATDFQRIHLLARSDNNLELRWETNIAGAVEDISYEVEYYPQSREEASTVTATFHATNFRIHGFTYRWQGILSGCKANSEVLARIKASVGGVERPANRHLELLINTTGPVPEAPRNFRPYHFSRDEDDVLDDFSLRWDFPTSDGGSAIKEYRLTPRISATNPPVIVLPHSDDPHVDVGSGDTELKAAFEVFNNRNITVDGVSHYVSSIDITAINQSGGGETFRWFNSLWGFKPLGSTFSLSRNFYNDYHVTWHSNAPWAPRSGEDDDVRFWLTSLEGGLIYLVWPFSDLNRRGSSEHGPGQYVTVRAEPTLAGRQNARDAITRTVNMTDRLDVLVPTALPPPAKPLNLRETAKTETTITIAWAKPKSEGGSQPLAEKPYRVAYREAGSMAEFTEVDTDQTSHEITGLTLATEYQICVMMVNPSGTGPNADLRVSTLSRDPPSAPRNLRATSRQTKEITIAWDEPAQLSGTAISGYRVRYREGTSGDYTTITTAARTVTIDSLAPATAHQFRVAGITEYGTGTEATGTFSTIAGIPDAPALTTTAAGNSITLNWEAPESDGGAAVTGYTVGIRENDPSSSFADTNKAAAARTHTFSGLDGFTEYQVYVLATNSVGNSPRSEADVITLAGKPSAVVAPSIASITSTSITLQWFAPEDLGGGVIETYRVRYRKGNSGPYTEAFSDDTSLEITGLEIFTAYEFLVDARTSGGYGPSEAVAGSTDAGPPGPVANLAATRITGTEIGISWSPPANNGGAPVTDYVVETAVWTPGLTILPPGFRTQQLNATYPNRSPNTEYIIRVFAENRQGRGPGTDILVTTLTLPPSPPTMLTLLRVTGTTISISWVAPIDVGGDSDLMYFVSWREAGDTGSFTSQGVEDNLTYEITGLDVGTSYDVRVVASNGGGAGEAVAARYTTPALPGAPENFIATSAGVDSITLSWAPPADNGGSGITNYIVGYRLSGAGGPWAEVTTAGLTTTLTALAGGTIYECRVQAVTVAGTGPATEASFTTLFSGIFNDTKWIEVSERDATGVNRRGVYN